MILFVTAGVEKGATGMQIVVNIYGQKIVIIITIFILCSEGVFME